MQDDGNSSANFTQNYIPSVRAHGPESVDFYMVTPDQLTLLEAGSKDRSWDFVLVCIGGFVGSLPSGVTGVVRYVKAGGEVFIPAESFIQIIIMLASLISLIILTIVHRSRSSLGKTLIGQIKSQKKTPDQSKS